MGLYKRKDSKFWWMKINYEGRVICKSTETDNRKLAEKIYEKVKASILLGKYFPEKELQNYTFLDLAEQYHEYAKGRIRSYERSLYPVIQKYLLACFKNMKLSEINTHMVESFQSFLIQKGLTPASINKYLTVLKAMIAKAVDWGICSEEVLKQVRKVKPLKNVNKRLRYLSTEEFNSLIQACSPHLKPIVIVAVLTGMRKGEILNLKWEQVDLKHGYILLNKTKNNERREIPIGLELKKLFLSLPKKEGIPYVFYNPQTGQPYTDVKRAFRTACKKAGIKDFHFHDLRHTFASHLVMAGTSIAVVQELLGHKDIKMTMRYSHLSPEHKKEAIKTLENIVIKGTKPQMVTNLVTVDKKGLTQEREKGYISNISGA